MKKNIKFLFGFAGIIQLSGCTSFSSYGPMPDDNLTDEANMPYVAQSMKNYEERLKFKRPVTIRMSEKGHRFLSPDRRAASQFSLEMRKDMMASAEAKLVSIVSGLRDFQSPYCSRRNDHPRTCRTCRFRSLYLHFQYQQCGIERCRQCFRDCCRYCFSFCRPQNHQQCKENSLVLCGCDFGNQSDRSGRQKCLHFFRKYHLYKVLSHKNTGCFSAERRCCLCSGTGKEPLCDPVRTAASCRPDERKWALCPPLRRQRIRDQQRTSGALLPQCSAQSPHIARTAGKICSQQTASPGWSCRGA